jgi:hypothetical protein
MLGKENTRAQSTIIGIAVTLFIIWFFVFVFFPRFFDALPN